MSAQVHAHQPDGSWRPAQPLPMTKRVEWEVYDATAPYSAEAFCGHAPVAFVTAKTRLGLVLKINVRDWLLKKKRRA